MVIRKRITDPFGGSEEEFQKFRRYGPAKTAPRKPSLEEREPFVRALKQVPMGHVMPKTDFFRSVMDRYAHRQFKVWGQTLYIWPRYHHLPDDRVKCSGAMVGLLAPEKRDCRRMLLTEEDQLLWYGRVIFWLEETCYT